MEKNCLEIAVAWIELVKAAREEWKEWKNGTGYASGGRPDECDADEKEEILKCEFCWTLRVYQ